MWTLLMKFTLFSSQDWIPAIQYMGVKSLISLQIKADVECKTLLQISISYDIILEDLDWLELAVIKI